MMPEGRGCRYLARIVPKNGIQVDARQLMRSLLTFDHAEVDLSDFEYRVLALSSENFAEIVDVPQPLYEIEEIPSAESSTPVKAAAEETLVVLNINKMRLATFGSSLPTRSKHFHINFDDMHVMYRNKDGKTILPSCPSLALYDSKTGVPDKLPGVWSCPGIQSF